MAIIKPVDESLISLTALPGFAQGHPNIAVSMLRLDAIHPIVSGNKWYKLKHNLHEAKAAGKAALLSFGGAYSNHLIACAAAAHSMSWSSIGIVRGEQDVANLNPVLAQCTAYGMQLHFVTRSEYAQRNTNEFQAYWQALYPHAWLVPEGGANAAGRLGAASICQLIPSSITDIVLSVGSGTTMAGIAQAAAPQQRIWGFAPMKGGAYLMDDIKPLISAAQYQQCQMIDRFHFGGFGKISPEVVLYMQDFASTYGFAVDRVYTAKMMMGLQELIAEGVFPEASQILCIHTGGLTRN
jgi:1-aminocyclopropane-1-carboxylate deaminase